ncbi:MAG TPA: hypothetical protein VFV99_15440 [Kofleriaceae bacterium]|nr:hypothetical protein [Kofleriaceae bacterium]
MTLAIAVLAGCGDDGHKVEADARLEGFDKPDLVCPGDPQCKTAGDGVLKVGVAKRTYTPQNFETYTDENMDRQWQTTEPYTDLNGNGKFDGVWLFGGARAALGVTTDVEVRAMAFEEGDMRIVIAYVDCVGMFVGDMDSIREDPALASLGIDHIIIGSTHAHDAPDTAGIWGPRVGESGREQFVIDKLHAAAVEAIAEAVNNVQPAQMIIASSKTINDPTNEQSKTDDWWKDLRDPQIMDPTLTIARFVKVSNPSETIGTLVNWADHPEVAHFDDTVPATITAHYPHWLRDHVENGVLTTESKYALQDLAGLGGITVFVQGALGGQIGSLRGTHPPGPGGVPVTKTSHAMDQALGTNAAAVALTALRDKGESTSDLPLSFKSAKFYARVDNLGIQVYFILGILGPHPTAGYNPDEPIDETNTPWLPLRATYVQIGPLGLVTTPGELHPELWVGGYNGEWSFGWPLLQHAGHCADNNNDCNEQQMCNTGVECVPTPNLPKFDEAPQPPYMRDLVLAHDGVRYPVVAGLAEDYVGYIVPAYNFVLATTGPWLNEAEGDHYEEVYCLSKDAERHIVDSTLALLKYRR